MLEPVPEPSFIPEHRRVLPLERVGALIEIVICSGFPTQILLILVLRGLGIPMFAADGRLSPHFIFTLTLLDAVLVVGLVLTFLRAHGESARAVLFGNARLIREALIGLATLPAVFMLVMLVLVLILRFAPQLHNVPTNPFEDMLRTRGDAMIFAVVVMVAGGVREEVQRGFIVHRFGQYLGGALVGRGRIQRDLRRWTSRPGLRRDDRDRTSRVCLGTALHLATEHRRTGRQPRDIQPRAAPEIPGVCRKVARRMLSRREVLLLLFLFIVSLPAVTARLYSSDEVEYFSYLRSLWFDRDVSFENEYQYFYDHHVAQSPDFHQTFLELETATHRRINYGTIGCAILWAPFYAVADIVTRTRHAAGSPVEANGFSQPYVSAVAYGSAFYGFATILLAIAAVRRMNMPHAFSSGLAVWWGTPLVFYMYVAPPFSHACSAFAVALFVTVWLHVRRSWSVGGVVALGFAGALMAMVREQDLFFTLGPALDYALALGKGQAPAARARRDQPPPRLRRSAEASAKAEVAERERAGVGSPRAVREADTRPLSRVLVGCAAFALGYLPQLLAYQALNGFPRPSPLVTRKMFWHSPHALQVLADPEHGFFFWTPLAVLAIAGLVLMVVASDARRGGRPTDAGDIRQVGLCMLLMVALQVYISGAVESWTVAGAFGQRRFVAVTVFLVVGLAALREYVTSRVATIATTAAVVFCVWWNLALTAEFGTSMMDRQKLELRRNAYDAFVTLPRMAPDLLYRYFTNRSSFYKPADTPR